MAATGRNLALVADSSDRRRFTAEKAQGRPLPRTPQPGSAEDDVRKVRAIEAQRKDLEARIAAASRQDLVFAGIFRKPDTIHLLNRGDPEQPKEEVVPALLSVLSESSSPSETDEQERRRVLADWIAAPENPLTARVMVNRIWQGHFGIGLVDTASDFGRMGSKPVAPRAARLAGRRVHPLRLVGQADASADRSLVHLPPIQPRLEPEASARDADARLLWRFPSAAA